MVNPGLAQHKALDFRSSHIFYLGGGFIFFLLSPLFGEDFQFGYVFFSDGLKPPTSYGVGGGATARVNCRFFFPPACNDGIMEQTLHQLL